MNVILITLDACRLDHLKFAGYGRDTTPNLSKITKEGAIFLNNYTPIPQSDPAITSILTGMYPHNHGIRNFANQQNIEVPTLQKILKDKGYKTACMSIEQNHNNSIRPGFDEFNKLSWRIKSKLKRMLKKCFNWKYSPGVSQITTDNAINWINKNKNNNFFLYLHYMELHWPYSPPPPFDHIFDMEYKGSHRFNDLDHGKIKRGDLIFNNTLSEEERKHAIAHYDGAILYMDSQIKRLVDFLKKKELWDESIIVIVGDHGEHLGEHDFYYQHVASLYEQSLKVPLFVKYPGSIKGKQINKLTQNIDILPTILDVLGLKSIKEMDGINLKPIIEGNTENTRKYCFAESGVSLFKQNKRKYFDGDKSKWKMVTDGNWKLIQIPHPDGDIHELYKISEDPLEKNNLEDQEKEILESLKKKLELWMENKQLDTNPEPGVYTPKEEDKIKERLRRLGYID